jgi:hypothetical protein
MPPPAGSEKRQGERLIKYWEEKIAQYNTGAQVRSLAHDLAAMHTEDWAHRFVVATDLAFEDISLLLYGSNIAKLLDVPPERTQGQAPAIRHSRFFEAFQRGCVDAVKRNGPVRLEGVLEWEDGRQELFRCAFIPIEAEEGATVRLVLGAFNCRFADNAGG